MVCPATTVLTKPKHVVGSTVDLPHISNGVKETIRTTTVTTVTTQTHTGEPSCSGHSIDYFCLLDVSSSMSGKRLDDGKSAIQQSVQLMNDTDRIALITFDTNAYYKLKPRAVGQIRRQNELPGLFGRIYAEGCTALYDAIVMALDSIKDKTKPTVIVVMTDGEDNSSHFKHQDVLAKVAKFPMVHLAIVDITDQPREIYKQLCEAASFGVYMPVCSAENIVSTMISTVQTVIKTMTTTVLSAVGTTP
jgi:Mg-chelatase subunit ChlD